MFTSFLDGLFIYIILVVPFTLSLQLSLVYYYSEKYQLTEKEIKLFFQTLKPPLNLWEVDDIVRGDSRLGNIVTIIILIILLSMPVIFMGRSLELVETPYEFAVRGFWLCVTLLTVYPSIKFHARIRNVKN